LAKKLKFSILAKYPNTNIMLQDKDTKKIWELKKDFTHRWLEVDFLHTIIKAFHFSTLIKSFSDFKKRGYGFELVLSVLISQVFMGDSSINGMVTNKRGTFSFLKKDVFYRLKGNPTINWRVILWRFSMQFVKIMEQKSEQQQGIRCLILDDSLLEKTGKAIERISRVWDHVKHRSVLGFKLNLMGYWDGFSFIPVDFSLHREKGKNKKKPFGLTKKDIKKQFKKKRPVELCSKERLEEADETKIETGLKMFKRAIKRGLKVDYLLMDSWFTSSAFIEAVRNVKNQTVYLIGMYKIARTKFEYNDKAMTYSQIRNELGKYKRNRKTGLHYLEAEAMLKGKPIKLFFSRKGKRGKWKTFITTNTQLSFSKMIEIYQIRWTIEVFFKESKQLLGLGTDQANDFDSQIAATTITLLQHILITTRFRFDNYESKGKLFSQAKAEVLQISLSERLWGLLLQLLKLIIELFEQIDEDELMEKILEDEKTYRRIEKLLEAV
jgi:hypothetical protein